MKASARVGFRAVHDGMATWALDAPLPRFSNVELPVRGLRRLTHPESRSAQFEPRLNLN